MPNIKSAMKRAKQSEARRLRNNAQRSALRTAVKTAERSIATGAQGQASYILAQKKLDQATSKGIIHRNAAARKKSRLARKLNAIVASQEA